MRAQGRFPIVPLVRFLVLRANYVHTALHSLMLLDSEDNVVSPPLEPRKNSAIESSRRVSSRIPYHSFSCTSGLLKYLSL
jgi:hypothetical protein